MLDIIDATNTIESVLPEFPAVTTESQTERQLEEEIGSLWTAHVDAEHTARATNAELRTIRAKLAEHLHAMKELLAKPGRDGQWSGFLREHEIPRATADRLVARHQAALNPNINCVSGADLEPTDEEVQKLFNSVWPKLRRVLRTRKSFLLFVDLLTSNCEFEATDGEIESVGSTTFPAVVNEEPTVKPEFVTEVGATAYEEVM